MTPFWVKIISSGVMCLFMPMFLDPFFQVDTVDVASAWIEREKFKGM